MSTKFFNLYGTAMRSDSLQCSDFLSVMNPAATTIVEPDNSTTSLAGVPLQVNSASYDVSSSNITRQLASSTAGTTAASAASWPVFQTGVPRLATVKLSFVNSASGAAGALVATFAFSSGTSDGTLTFSDENYTDLALSPSITYDAANSAYVLSAVSVPYNGGAAAAAFVSGSIEYHLVSVAWPVSLTASSTDSIFVNAPYQSLSVTVNGPPAGMRAKSATLNFLRTDNDKWYSVPVLNPTINAQKQMTIKFGFMDIPFDVSYKQMSLSLTMGTTTTTSNVVNLTNSMFSFLDHNTVFLYDVTQKNTSILTRTAGSTNSGVISFVHSNGAPTISVIDFGNVLNGRVSFSTNPGDFINNSQYYNEWSFASQKGSDFPYIYTTEGGMWNYSLNGLSFCTMSNIKTAYGNQYTVYNYTPQVPYQGGTVTNCKLWRSNHYDWSMGVAGTMEYFNITASQ